jgi:tol-pal system protein YbgF
MKLSLQKLSNNLYLGLCFLLVIILLASAEIYAQAAVVEAGGATPPAQAQTANTNNSGSSNDVVINLYLQLEALQQEVQTLRGVMEEQSYQIRRMQTESRDRYIDIDSRLSGLANSGVSDSGLTASTPTPPVNSSGISARGTLTDPGRAQTSPDRVNPPGRSTVLPPTNPTATAPLVASTRALNMPENEQELYRTALNLLVEDSNYEDSISMFQQYIDVYSSGRYLANAYYWQGEALILVERYNQAKEAFMMVFNNYSQDAKAPGALMKLVVTYIQMGDITQASQTLQDLRTQYPDSLTEISAAEDYLRRAEG